jgi:hypothetical protein
MPIQAYFVIAIFLILAVRSCATQKLERKLTSIKQGIYYKKLIIDHMERLDRWQQARPFIHRGYCEYARSLILEMIEAYEYLLAHHHEKNHEPLCALRRLLFEFPPDYDPPIPGGLFFIIG